MAKDVKAQKKETPVELTDRMRELLGGFSESEIVSGVVVTNRPPAEGLHSAAALRKAHAEAVTAHNLGELLRAARESEGRSLSGAAGEMKVTKGRIAQIEKSGANLRISTLQRAAQTYGYKVQVTLVPEDEGKTPITTELPAPA